MPWRNAIVALLLLATCEGVTGWISPMAWKNPSAVGNRAWPLHQLLGNPWRAHAAHTWHLDLCMMMKTSASYVYGGGGFPVSPSAWERHLSFEVTYKSFMG